MCLIFFGDAGNMWAQQWNLIYDLTTPFPGKSSVDVTPQMLHQVHTILHMDKGRDIILAIRLPSRQ